MVTTLVVLDCEATCGLSVCGIYFNTNHTNLTNCAGVNLQQGNNSIRVKEARIELPPTRRFYPARLVRFERFVFKETRIELPSTWRFYPARLERFERFVLKETTHTAVPHVASQSGTTWVEPWNVKNAGQWNKCILTLCLPTSATVVPIYPRVFPTSVIEISTSQIDFSTSQIDRTDFQQKRGKSPVGVGSILFAIQIYDIFRRNPNPVNISQHLSKG